MSHLTPYERHMLANPAATILESEWNWLQHVSRWGADSYPVRKLGRKWEFQRMYNAGGCPSLFKTKREAVARVELYYDMLLDKNAGRAPGTTTARRQSEAAARERGEAVT